MTIMEKLIDAKPSPSATIIIWCLILGHAEDQRFKFRVDDLSKYDVADLRKEFVLYGMKPPFVLHKVQGARSQDALQIQDFLPGTKLSGMETVMSEYWTPEELVSGHIHVVATPSISPLPQLEDEAIKFIRKFEKTEHPKAYYSTSPTPSQLCEAQQTAGRILKGRPAKNCGPPIELYHSVFDRFRQIVSSTDEISSETSVLTHRLLYMSQKTYDVKFHPDMGIKRILEQLVGGAFEETMSTGEVIAGVGGACCVVMALQNELEDEGCDPSIRAALTYSKYWSDSSMDRIRAHSCCPSIVMAVAGPLMCVLGAVFLDRPVVQLLTDFLWIDPQQTGNSRDHLAQIFTAVFQTQKDLQEYYGTIFGTYKNPRRFFPHITHYVDSSGQRVEFSYTGRLGTEESPKLVFTATTRATDGAKGKKIAIKFVDRYNAKAHMLLAEAGLAPKLLFDSSSARIIARRYMVVMDFVPGADLSTKDGVATEKVRGDIRNALDVLHAENLVYGDLLKSNVMVVKDSSGKVTGGILVDFDACGEHGKDRYPLAVDDWMNRREGMKYGVPMCKEHDEKMFEELRV